MRVRAIMVIVAVALAFFAPVSAAVAHDQLLGSTPQNGSVLPTAPTQVALTFNQNVLDLGNAIRVLDQEGTDWADGDVQIVPSGVQIALRSGMPDGMYTVQWRVVSADGHPVSSSFVYGVGASSELANSVASAASAIAIPATQDAAGYSASSSGGAGTSGSTFWSVLGIGAFGALVALALFLSALAIIQKRNSRRSARTEEKDL